MAELDSLKTLKIQSFTTAMKYGVRDDFASRRQEVIDAVRREIGSVLRAANKPGPVEAQVDTDGDLVFQYEHSSFHFRLDTRPNLSGVQFPDLYEHNLAFKIVKKFYGEVIRILGLHDVDVLSLDYRNIFDLQVAGKDNVGLFEERLMPSMRSALAPLVSEDARLARVDFKVGWDYDDRRTCYYTIECPANDENTTLWSTLNLRTRDDINVVVDENLIIEDVDKGYEVYCGSYAEHLTALLAHVDINYDKRRLREK